MEFFLATLSGFLLPAALFTYKNYVNERSQRRKLEQEIKKEQEEKMRTLTSGVCMLMYAKHGIHLGGESPLWRRSSQPPTTSQSQGCPS